MLSSLSRLLGHQQQPEESLPQTPMQQRMRIVIDQYSSAIPITLRPMLSGLLHTLDDKLTDDKILEFTGKTRALLDYIEQGMEPEAEDDAGINQE